MISSVSVATPAACAEKVIAILQFLPLGKDLRQVVDPTLTWNSVLCSVAKPRIEASPELLFGFLSFTNFTLVVLPTLVLNLTDEGEAVSGPAGVGVAVGV